jgi:hypothetical protein
MPQRRVLICWIIVAMVGLVHLRAEKKFPVWRGSSMLIPGTWLASPIVAVGEIVNVRPYGDQEVASLPRPMSPDVHTLHWCEGELKVSAAVKGKLPAPPKKYLWASGLSGCHLDGDEPMPSHLVGSKGLSKRQETRAWFLREEGEFLRPTFDGGTARFLSVFANWKDGPALPARQRLGKLLLTPGANSDSLDHYADYLWDVGDIACDLLGKAECAQQIRGLMNLGSPSLRDAACNFLKGQLGAACGTQ